MITVTKEKYEQMKSQINKILDNFDSSKGDLTFEEALTFMQAGKAIMSEYWADLQKQNHIS